MTQNPYSSPASPVIENQSGMLEEAPGAKVAFHCGLWALISVLLCFPVSLVLGIVALVQSSKAKRLALTFPETYQYPTNAGMIMSIVALSVLPILFIIGMVSAIAIPALLGQRTRARDKATISNTLDRMGDLVNQYEQISATERDEPKIVSLLENHLQESAKQDKNPWNAAQPAFSYTISVASEMDQDSLTEFAKTKATELGQGVFVIQFPSVVDGQTIHPGYLAGVAKIKNPVDHSTFFVKVTEL